MGDERRAYDTQRDNHSVDAALATLAARLPLTGRTVTCETKVELLGRFTRRNRPLCVGARVSPWEAMVRMMRAVARRGWGGAAVGGRWGWGCGHAHQGRRCNHLS